jgi:enamine deaminase RidA (YjgF/YER057c/UK114 family)
VKSHSGPNFQTEEVLGELERLPRSAGTGKSKLLAAQAWLKDISDFSAMNAVWNAWIDRDNPPVRACIDAAPWQPGMRIEVMAPGTVLRRTRAAGEGHS